MRIVVRYNTHHGRLIGALFFVQNQFPRTVSAHSDLHQIVKMKMYLIMTIIPDPVFSKKCQNIFILRYLIEPKLDGIFLLFPIITPFSPRCGSVKLLAVTVRFRFASSRCGLSPYRQNRLRLKENKFSSAAAGFLYTARSLIKVELVEPLVHCLIAEADHLIFSRTSSSVPLYWQRIQL